MTLEQREVDREARLTISQELGHEREAVTLLTWVGENPLFCVSLPH